MHEAAVVEAVDAELPQGAVGVERLDAGFYLGGREAGRNLLGHSAHRCQVAPDQVVYPSELANQRVPSGGGTALTHARFPLVACRARR